MTAPNRLALLTPAQTAAIDSAGDVLAWMENAGRMAARAILRHWTPRPVLVACGPGANGGDGYVVARHLERAGWPVRVAALSPPREGSPAAAMAARWRGPIALFLPEAAARAGLVVDAVFGAGLSRDIDDRVADLLAAAPALAAIDVPSGLDGATGLAKGRVRAADLTIALSWARPGHYLLPGRALCGTLEIVDIGIPPAALERLELDAWRNAPGLWTLPPLAPDTAAGGGDSHKYSRGAVGVIGAAEMTGAARLAAGAARRAGAGLVTIAAESGADLYRTGDPGLIVDASPLSAQVVDPRRLAWVCGPGLPPAQAGEVLKLLLKAGRHVIADAGALAACAGRPKRLRGVRIVTPHVGEFAKVFGRSSSSPDWRGRPDEVRAAAKAIGAVVVLKGTDTVIAAPDGRIAINTDAPPVLATAGAGDVLSGITGALLARGIDDFDAACAAVWLHGRAAQLARHGRSGDGVIAEDIAPWLGTAWAEAHALAGREALG